MLRRRPVRPGAHCEETEMAKTDRLLPIAAAVVMGMGIVPAIAGDPISAFTGSVRPRLRN